MRALLALYIPFLLIALVAVSVLVAAFLIFSPLIVPALMSGLIDTRARPLVAGESMGVERCI